MPGGILGGYRIDSFVAAGGMGEVYLARERFSGRRVALKRVKADLQGRPDLAERLQIEARILAELNHPNIVAMLYSGEHEGHGYIVMEWLEGKTLREFMNHRRKPLDLPTVLYYAILIAGALRAAHKVGILHRDLKPENIFMLEGGKLKVLDFGLGKLTEREHASTTDRLVQMGTVHYAAPEQLERTGLDERTDLYALALILLEMATGQHAFSDLPGVLPHKEIVQANHMFAAPNSLRALVPTCPESLAALVDRALCKDRTQRPTTEEFLAALRAERSALIAAKPVEQPAPLDEEDNADEPAPPSEGRSAAPNDAAHAAPRPPMPQLTTEKLPDDFEPQDPSAARVPYRFEPVRYTLKLPDAPSGLPRKAPAALGRAAETTTPQGWDVSSSLRERAAETTGSGRVATLPPPPEPALPPQAPRPVSAPAPLVARAWPPLPEASGSAPARSDEGLRPSVAFANRPTTPWRRPPHARSAVPLWAAPVVGVLLTLGVFALVVGLRARTNRPPAVEAPALSVSADPAVVAVATASAAASIEPAASGSAAPSVESPPSAPGAASSALAPAATAATLPVASAANAGVAAASPRPNPTGPRAVPSSKKPLGRPPPPLLFQLPPSTPAHLR